MKTLVKVVLLLAIVGCGFWLYQTINNPIQFNDELSRRSAQVVERLKNIREAQQTYKKVYGKYAENFDTLIDFIKNDSLTLVVATGSLDDSVAVAKGLVKQEEYRMAVKDTLFSGRNVNIDELPLVPFGNGERFEMGATTLKTESEVVIPVFEVKAQYRVFLKDLGKDQELINLYDKSQSADKYPGLKVGSLTQAINDAGNWEN